MAVISGIIAAWNATFVEKSCVPDPCVGCVVPLHPEVVHQLPDEGLVLYWAGNFDSPVEVPWHPITRRNVHFWLGIVAEGKKPRVLQISPHDTDALDILGYCWKAGNQRVH